MTWRLKAIALYQREGKGREVLEFRLHGVNIITGNSQTGKSAIIDIVNYGLMSESCPIPKGTIRRAVSHVGIHLKKGEEELQIIRPLPAQGTKTTTQAWWQLGSNLAFPNEVPDMRWNRAQVKGILSDFTGITGAAVLTNTRDPTQLEHQATIRHAAPLIFQPQDVIANRYVSFPGLDSADHRRHILDALPFLLKIESAELLEKRAELRRLKVDLRAKLMRGAEQKMLRADVFPRGLRLWMECHGRGLVQGEPPADVPSLLSQLSTLEVTEAARFELSTSVPDIQRLEAEEQRARGELVKARKQIREIRRFEDSTRLHDTVVGHQIRRLKVAELLPDPENDVECPVCRDGRLDSTPARMNLKTVLAGLATMQTIPMRIDDKARKARIALERERTVLEEKHEAAKAALREAIAFVARESPQVAESRALDVLRGKVQEYLDSVKLADYEEDDEGLAELKARIEFITAELEAREGVRKAFEAQVSKEMTALAKKMEVEFIDGQAKLDLRDLSISVQVDQEEDAMTALSEIGSGANWVSYHVAAAAALHRHLVRQDCPVPRLLILDQPSQAWFPKIEGQNDLETATRPDANRPRPPKKPEDLERVQSIYRLLQAEAARKDASQVIVLDHAYIDEEWFTADIIREWRGGAKLVPPHWDAREDSAE